MSTSSDQDSCARSCWFAAALTGVVMALLLMFLWRWGFVSAFILGFAAAMAVGFGLRAVLCAGAGNSRIGAGVAHASDPMVSVMADTHAENPVAVKETDVDKNAASAVPADETPEKPGGNTTMQQDDVSSEDNPPRLEAPRDGKGDDLTLIKGVGPKLNQLLNQMGYFHFDQIAGWSAADVAWMDDNLKGFRGRVSRDDWVAQSKILAEGGETEFSKRRK